MYIDLQKNIHAKSPIIITFQASIQVVKPKNVEDHVNVAKSASSSTGSSRKTKTANPPQAEQATKK